MSPKIKIRRKILIENINPTDRKIITDSLTLPNPNYWKMKNMGKWVGNIPEYFEYYQIHNADLIIPRGCRARTERYFGTKAETDFVLAKISHSSKFGAITLRDYQQAIYDHWLATRPTEGIFELSTAFGKSVLALAIIRELGLTATILAPNNTILTQFVGEAKKHLGYDIGIVNGQKKEIKDITVACVASLYNNKELLAELVARTSVLIVDECAGFVSDKRLEVLTSFNPSYLYGLTATPEREDGQTEAIKFYFGDIIESYSLDTITPTVEVYANSAFIPLKERYDEMIDYQINLDTRNKLIAGIALGEVLAENKKILILTKRIEHYQKIAECLPPSDQIILADSGDSSLHEKLNNLRNNQQDFSIILGTFSLLATGFNIEKLDCLIIAGDLKSSVLTHQSAGRVLRLLSGKTAKIIDIMDENNGILRAQFNSRRKFYEKKNWPINYHPFFKQPKI